MVAVVAIHAANLVPSMVFLLPWLWFAIPLFIIVSGYLLAGRHPEGVRIGPFFKNIFFRVFMVYAIVVIGVRLAFGEITGKNILVDLIAGGMDNSYYFIPIILQCYLLFPFIIRMRRMLAHPLMLSLLFWCSSFFWFLETRIQHPAWNTNLWSLVFVGRYLFYFVLGIALASYKIRELSWRQMALPAFWYLCSMILLSWKGETLILTTLYPAVFFFMLLFLPRTFLDQPGGVLVLMGRHSLVVYLFQTIILFSVLQPFMQYLSVVPEALLYFIIIILASFASLGTGMLFMAGYRRALAFFSRNIQA